VLGWAGSGAVTWACATVETTADPLQDRITPGTPPDAADIRAVGGFVQAISSNVIPYYQFGELSPARLMNCPVCPLTSV
jgi:hypothetical protein